MFCVFFKDLLIFILFCLNMCMCTICVQCLRGQLKSWFPETRIQIFVSHHVGAKICPRSSAGAAGTLSCWAFLPLLESSFLLSCAFPTPLYVICLYFLIYVVCACLWGADICMEITGQLWGINLLFPPHGFWGQSPGHQTWWQVPHARNCLIGSNAEAVVIVITVFVCGRKVLEKHFHCLFLKKFK